MNYTKTLLYDCIPGKKFCKWHFKYFFLFFWGNRIWHFFLRGQFAWSYRSYFLEKIRKISSVCNLLNLPIAWQVIQNHVIYKEVPVYIISCNDLNPIHVRNSIKVKVFVQKFIQDIYFSLSKWKCNSTYLCIISPSDDNVNRSWIQVSEHLVSI